MTEDLSTLDNGRYKLQEILGQGGMAVVYKAWDNRLRVERAIKILSPQIAKRQSLRKRFENEARTMARLAHPNIVSVTDVVEEGEHFFMVMELVTGGTLWDWVTAHGRMPPRLALEHLRPVLDAMGAAHEAGVIHRDIKPQNIMLTADGLPKVTDFGIAHVQDLFNTGNLTRTGSVMGTWGYMAPEQRQSARGVDGRSDVYALGATLYAVVTADLPVDLFAAAQDEDVLDRVPKDLHRLVRKATRYRADDRYQDVAEMAAACDTVLARLPALPGGTPRIGPDPDFVPARPTTAPVPFAPTATAQLASGIEPAPRETPPPLRTQQGSDETFDFGLDSEIDPPEDKAPLPSGTLADTPVHTHRHTAVPDLTSSAAPRGGDTGDAPSLPTPSRWRLPLVASLLLGVVAVPSAWYGLREPAPEMVVKDDPTRATTLPPTTVPEPGPDPAEPEPEPEVEAENGRDTIAATPVVKPTIEPTAGAGPGGAAEPAGQPTRAAKPSVEPAAEPGPSEPTAPIVTEPEPLERPPVELEPATVPAPATVGVQGEVDELRLIDEAGKPWSPGELPAGTYKIEALFPGGSAPIVAGKITLEPGQSHTLNCVPTFKKCK